MESLQIRKAHRNYVMRILQKAEMQHGKLIAMVPLADQMARPIRCGDRRSSCSAIIALHQNRPMVGVQGLNCYTDLLTILNYTREKNTSIITPHHHHYLKTLIEPLVVTVARLQLGDQPQLLRVRRHQRRSHHKRSGCHQLFRVHHGVAMCRLRRRRCR